MEFQSFISLFEILGINSFEEDPPNEVLLHSEEQRTYIIRLLNSDTDSATFSLELLPGESHNLNTVSGRMSLFVDGDKKIVSSGSSNIKIKNITFQYYKSNSNYCVKKDETWTQKNKLTSITFSDGTQNLNIKKNTPYNINILTQIQNLDDNISINAAGINPFSEDNKQYFEKYNKNYSISQNLVNTHSFSGSRRINKNKITIGYYVYTRLTISNTLNIEMTYNDV